MTVENPIHTAEADAKQTGQFRRVWRGAVNKLQVCSTYVVCTRLGSAAQGGGGPPTRCEPGRLVLNTTVGSAAQGGGGAAESDGGVREQPRSLLTTDPPTHCELGRLVLNTTVGSAAQGGGGAAGSDGSVREQPRSLLSTDPPAVPEHLRRLHRHGRQPGVRRASRRERAVPQDHRRVVHRPQEPQLGTA